ncbi:MAG TPA: patatin-like phospholipase family protein [Acidimicrobiales bacterium]|nr:patatin-like phospholipase family protein [Acidimicrobiales bacterium]
MRHRLRLGDGRRPREAGLSLRTALVLGAGGTVGMAYHAGVLRALEEVGGFRPDDADLVIGTSAGSMVGAMVRSGIGTEDLYRASLGEHPDLGLEPEGASPWQAVWESPFDVARRVIGSLYVLQRSALRVPMPHLPAGLRRAFPGGFFTIAEAEDTLATVMPTTWPAKPLWLVTVDVGTGRRVVLGRRNPPRTDLHTAVMASCAIPAFFTPQRVGRRTLVDGGVHSTTNLDLATKISPDVIVAVVPMGYDDVAPPGVVERIARNRAMHTLRREIGQAERGGARVLSLQPTERDLHAFGGMNMMRRQGNEQVTRIAYESAAERLARSDARDLLDEVRHHQPA